MARTGTDEILGQVEALSRLVEEHSDIVGLLDRVALLRATSHRIREDTGLDLGYAAALENADLLVIRGWAGAYGLRLRNLEVPRGLGLGGKTLATVRPMWVPDYCESSRITHQFDEVIRSEGIGAMVAVPLTYRDEVLGVAYGASRETADLGDTVISQLKSAAEPAAASLHLADQIDNHTRTTVASERRRMAIALHDSVGALLFSIGAEVRDLQSHAADAPELMAKLRDVEARIAETAAVFRESLAVLDVVAPKQALTATLRGDCEAFTRRTGVSARCVTLTDLPLLDAGRNGALVAITREALVNVEKHAKASSVVVSVACFDGGVTLAIADDGLGWASEPHPETSGGMGLKACHERVAQLGGTLSVVENEDGGITVRTRIPVVDRE
ncbi:MAG TPA: ATP-binding protein [Amycolatopsis sp.]|jgi:signal transduction histidine kinase|nr:ATP-binding protein [Amycolatopsis sp.]